jgi:hypothetical protein
MNELIFWRALAMLEQLRNADEFTIYTRSLLIVANNTLCIALEGSRPFKR